LFFIWECNEFRGEEKERERERKSAERGSRERKKRSKAEPSTKINDKINALISPPFFSRLPLPFLLLFPSSSKPLWSRAASITRFKTCHERMI